MCRAQFVGAVARTSRDSQWLVYASSLTVFVEGECVDQPLVGVGPPPRVGELMHVLCLGETVAWVIRLYCRLAQVSLERRKALRMVAGA